MRLMLHSRSLYVLIAALFIGIALFQLVRVVTAPKEMRVLGTVEIGDVRETVSVSGIVESQNTARLRFKNPDVVTVVNAEKGDVVKEGDILASQTQTEALAEYNNALASLRIAEADLDELLAGPRGEERDITDLAVQNAEAELRRATLEQADKVAHAKRILLSSALEALPQDTNNGDEAPVVTGTYTCETEGTYYLNVYPSAAKSGYSYRLEGLEEGTATANTDSPSALGNCGLRIQFAAGENYGTAVWMVAVPNTRSSVYAINLNAYELALRTQESTIESAEEMLKTALGKQSLENASPREEALRRASALVLQAEARLASAESRLADRTLIAPFNAIVSGNGLMVGETAGRDSAVMTLVGEDVYTLTARIPEIDIAKIEVSNKAEIVLDARSNEILTATVSFISPIATEIDGVAYFDAKLVFDAPPTWLRVGLNADVDIIVGSREDVLRIPKRFLIEREGNYFVRIPKGKEFEERSISVEFLGNNGYAAISGLAEGDSVIAP